MEGRRGSLPFFQEGDDELISEQGQEDYPEQTDPNAYGGEKKLHGF
jgi:hypothetical protein